MGTPGQKQLRPPGVASLRASETEFFSLASSNTPIFVKATDGHATELKLVQGGETYRGRKIK